MLNIAYFSICLTHFAILFLQPGKNRINFSNSVKFTVLIGNTHLKKKCHCFYLISSVYFTVHSYVHVFKLFFAFFILKIPKLAEYCFNYPDTALHYLTPSNRKHLVLSLVMVHIAIICFKLNKCCTFKHNASAFILLINRLDFSVLGFSLANFYFSLV